MSKSSIQDYYQLGRKTTMVNLKDRDVLFLGCDFLFGNVTQATLDLKPDAASPARFTTGPLDLDGKRILYFGRLSSNVLTNGLRIAACLSEDGTAIFPLQEVQQPTITYEPVSNLLTMTFWTTFSADWVPEDGYDPDQIYAQYNVDNADWDKEVPDDLQKALCVCIGSMQKYYISGGGLQDSDLIDDSLDFIPVFQFPKIIKPTGLWSDIPPYPGAAGEDTVLFTFGGPTTDLDEGQPLLPVVGTSGVDGNDVLILKSPADFVDADGIDASPYFYIYAGKGPQTPTGFQQLAKWPSGTFEGITDDSCNVGQSVGVVFGNADFVVGSAGARCIAYKETEGIAILARDQSSVLIRATGPVDSNRQLVQVLGEDDTLSSVDLNLFDPPLSVGPQGGGSGDGGQGLQGPTGPQAEGLQGTNGTQGTQGVQGPQGAGSQGFAGFQGAQGGAGSAGTQGVQGPQGGAGFQGFDGFDGFQGYQGYQGPLGFQGTMGFQGPSNGGGGGGQGFQGAQGSIGPQGFQGMQGAQGPQAAGGAVLCMIVADNNDGTISIDLYENGYSNPATDVNLLANILNNTHPILATAINPMEAFASFINGEWWVDQGMDESWLGKVTSVSGFSTSTPEFQASVYDNNFSGSPLLTGQTVLSINKIKPTVNDQVLLFRKFGGLGVDKWYCTVVSDTPTLHAGQASIDKKNTIDDGLDPVVNQGDLGQIVQVVAQGSGPTYTGPAIKLGVAITDGTNTALLSSFFTIVNVGGTRKLALKTDQNTTNGAIFTDGTRSSFFGFQFDSPNNQWRPRATFFF